MPIPYLFPGNTILYTHHKVKRLCFIFYLDNWNELMIYRRLKNQRAIKNGQSRDTGSIGHKTQNKDKHLYHDVPTV